MEPNEGEAGRMARFADPSLFTTVNLPHCGTCGVLEGEELHDKLSPGHAFQPETAVMRSEIGGGEARAASTRGGWIDRNRWLATPEKDREPDMPDFNGARSDAEFVARFTKSWTLRSRHGDPMPITAANALLLDEPTWLTLMSHVQAALDDDHWGALPNASSDPSPAGTSGTGSHKPARPKRR